MENAGTLTAATGDAESEKIRSLFDQIAPIYDRLNDGLSFGQHRIWKQMTVKWSQPHTGVTCLDLCCGSGDIARLLSRRVGQTGQVYGVDFSAALLEVARQRTLCMYPTSPIEWIEADVLDLPFEDGYFDAATMGYGLRNVTDIPKSLREIYRVLKPGATVAILDFHRPFNEQLRRFQAWYLEKIVVPRAEQWGVAAEYAYINPSLAKFPQGPEQVQLAHQAGFESATHYPIASGLMGVLVATKAGRSADR